MARNAPLILCLVLLFGSHLAAENGTPAPVPGKELPAYSEAEIKARFKAMPSIISKRYNEETRKRIRSYVYGRRAFAEDLLGRGAVYFPIIEQYLKQYDLPLELRVLPIIETNFDPLAVSRAGASGLWQFMQGTAEYMGLSTADGLDERFDIHRSTEAAVQYLARLYDKYQDWALALAAYNCGPRYVNRAIKRGKSRDFWTIARYLPRETQKYVPKFLAASYLVHYYHEHQLVPAFPELDLQITQDLRLPRGICLEELARIAGTPLEVLRKLNPAYGDGCVPEDPRGPMVTLPKRSADYVLGYLSMPVEGRVYFPQFEDGQPLPLTSSLDEYLVVYYPPQPEESLADAAALFQIEESLLRLWNGLEPDPVFDGERELLIYIPVRKAFHLPKWHLPRLPRYPGEGLSPLSEEAAPIDIVTIMADAVRPATYWLHTLGIGESPFEVCRQYNLEGSEVLREHNPQAFWTPGEVIRIPLNGALMADAR
jgi:membrane-bound lytic murein transglycosylase D